MASSHIAIDHASLSRMHAVIEVSPSGALTIIDLGSSTGTEVNGKTINKTSLSVGDVVRLGEVTIEVGAVADEPSAQQSAPGPQPSPMNVPAPGQVDPTKGPSAVFLAAIVGMLIIAVGMLFFVL